MFKVLSGKYISIGGTYSAESIQSFEGEIRAIPITDVALDDVDYCVVYQPSNSNAARFVNCLLSFSKSKP